MPKMGDGMEEGTLLEWLKKEGDKVASGEVIGTIQTDKATLELEAPGSGILAGILVNSGETVPVGKAIAALVKAGEELPNGWGGKSASSAALAGQEEKKVGKEESVSAEAKANGTHKEEAKGNGAAEHPTSASAAGRIKATPLARKIASEMGIDLSTVKGSGPDGRIVEKDVRGTIPSAKPVAGSAPVAAITQTADDRVIQLNKLRQITAQRTAQSKQQVPHFYVTVQVDVEKLMKLREQFLEEESGKVSVNDFVMRACALALQQMPVVNSTFQGTTVLQSGAIHLGMAVAIDDGLTVAVIKNAHTMGIRQLSDKARELAGKARDNKLSMDELSGSTFTISNMGMLEVDEFIAIINQPNAAILAVSTVKKQVVVLANDEIAVRRCMNISASFDHRVVDGAVGAKFINLVRGYLENPTRLFS